MPDDGSRNRGRVTVFGRNALTEPLLDDSEASIVVIRDRTGEPIAFFARLVDDTWAFANKGDRDWADAKSRFGIS